MWGKRRRGHSDTASSRRTDRRRRHLRPKGRCVRSFLYAWTLHQGPSTSPAHPWWGVRAQISAVSASILRRSCFARKAPTLAALLSVSGTFACRSRGCQQVWACRKLPLFLYACRRETSCWEMEARLLQGSTACDFNRPKCRNRTIQSSWLAMLDFFVGSKLCVAQHRAVSWQ